MVESPLIEVQHLSFAYQSSKWILHDISFKIDQGQKVGIIGPSGSGKTTLGYILKGLIPHSIKGYMEGNVYINGQNTRLSSISKLARTVGMVFQDLNAQMFSQTVGDEIAFGLSNLKLNPQWGEEAIISLGLQELINELPMNLSAGQKQRVILASVIAMRPSILILDEPSIHLDRTDKTKLKNWLLKLNETLKTTILIIEQDPWLVGNVCDLFIQIKDKGAQILKKEEVLEQTMQWSWKL